MNRRNWRIQTYNLLLELANTLDIDVAELLYEFRFTDYETAKFYEWCESMEV